jgi:spore coat polysaccharide biosynthesis protein SpsF
MKSSVGEKTALILQARTGSMRLPNKSLASLGDTVLIQAVFDRLSQVDAHKWLATTDLAEDSVLVDLAQENGWNYFRGSSHNVLSRFESILKNRDYEFCIRATGDNPFVSSLGINLMLQNLAKNGRGAYISDFDSLDFPVGAFAEVFRVNNFLNGIPHIDKHETWHFSHVTSWMRMNAFQLPLSLPDSFKNRPGWRWTLDLPVDLKFFNAAIELLGNSWISLEYADIVEVLDQNPNVVSLNSLVNQKKLELG